MLLDILKDLFRSRKAPAEGETLRVALELINASRPQEALDALAPLLGHKPDCVEALVMSGTAKRAAGRAKDAVADLTRAAALAPDDATCLYELAAACHDVGDIARALEHCERVRLIAPQFAAARWLQAQLLLGGEYYSAVLQSIHAELRPRTYVEIGIYKGEALSFARPPTQAIGIDPQPQLIAPLAANQRVFAETSDAFFAGHDLNAEFGGVPVDLAFIDGMHHFEFALRDFANLERHCTRDSTILVHDCYPLDRETARRDGSPPFWSGDIWRLIVLLKKYRPDLALHTIGAPPTGLALVRNLDPGSRFLSENHDRLCAEFLALDYAYLDDDKAGKLNLVANDWEQIRALLAAA